MNFFEELKRRNVFRVGLAYAIGGWLVVQVSDVVLEAIEAPPWVMKAILLLVMLGFVAALFFAWAFEATPEGIKREPEVDRSKSITHVTGRKLDRAIFAMLVVGLGYFVWESRLADRAPAIEKADTHAATSVAVLAFENMSPDPNNAYFAEGISEEILNVLAAVDGLQVASRTSAFSFAGTDTPIPEIASQLEVAHVLEGSVRRQGARVRITAQLIDAEEDKHLWSKTYDRELDDIFAVQEEIAVAIADALLGVLGMQQVVVSVPTTDMAAYELFLRGRQQFYARGAEGLRGAVADLEAAVERDPEFVDAWAHLAAAEWVVTGYVSMDDAEYETYIRRALSSAERALALDPSNALATAVEARVSHRGSLLESMQRMQRAVDLAPNDAGILMWAGDDFFSTGAYLEEALPLLERAYRLDPLSGINNGILGMAYLAAGRRELAYRHIQKAVELRWSFAEGSMILDRQNRGEADALLAENRASLPADETAWSAYQLLRWKARRQCLQEGLGDDAEAMLQQLAESAGYVVAWDCLAMAGDHERLFDYWLSLRPDLAGFLTRRLYIPGDRARALMEQPGMIEVAERLGMRPVWEARGYPFNCVLVEDERGEHLSCPEWPESAR